MNKKIYLPPIKAFPVNSLKDLIDSLYMYVPQATPKMFARPTYSDEKFHRVECVGSRRSFEDLLCLAQTYFPETTEVELMRVLIELRLTYLYCPDIRKIVFFRGGPGYNTINKYNLTTPDYSETKFDEENYTPKRLFEVFEQL